MKRYLLSIVSFWFVLSLTAQVVINKPTCAEQTHPELIINSIQIFKDSTVINLSVENKLVQGGWFCADKNIFLETPSDHKKTRVIKANGIPTCPSVHSFKRIGEMLSFSLVFPGIPAETKLLNLVEDCDKSCFSFKGIILDEKLNADIKLYSKGVEFYAANKTTEAIECFTKVVETIPAFPTHVYGYSYFNLIRIFYNNGNKITAKFWLDQLEKSTLPDKQYFINSLQKEGIQLK